MAKNSKPEKEGRTKDMLSFVTQMFGKKKSVQTIDVLVDSMMLKNDDTVRQLQKQVRELDLFSFPSSARAAKYRWERLIRDLLDHSAKLKYLQDRVQNGRVQTALNMFTYELWPVTLRIACRYEIETGKQGDWIEDTSALYVKCETQAAQETVSDGVRENVDGVKLIVLERIEQKEKSFDNDKAS